jgi:hypothetical protein
MSGHGTYLVRVNCEYSQLVTAPDEQAAIDAAMQQDVAGWESAAWSEPEAELEPSQRGCDACGAEPGERCRDHCTALVSIQNDAEDAAGDV